MDQIALKMGSRGKNSVFCTKNTSFFAEILFAEQMLTDEIILSEVSLGGSPTINFSLVDWEQFTATVQGMW